MGSSTKPFLSVVIPTFNAEKNIQRLLQSIEGKSSESKESNGKFEVIVVDDCSKDATLKLAKEFPASFSLCSYCLEKNSGPAVARNFGVQKAKGKVIVFLDSDVELESNVLEQFEKHFKSGSERKCVVGVYSKNPIVNSVFQHYRALVENFWVQELKEADYFTPACGAVSKKILQEIGGFNARYRQLEDYDIGYRLAGKCKIKVDKSIKVRHLFSPFWKCAERYFARSFVWVRMFLKRGKFDNWGSTPSNALASILALLTAIGIAGSLVAPLLAISTIIVFAGFVFLNARFYFFVAREFKVLFIGYAVIAGFLLGIVISSGAVYSVLALPFKNVGRKWLE